MNKTGTSALQYWCQNNRKLLLKQGLLYPQTGIAGVAHYDISNIFGFKHNSECTTNKFADASELVAQLDREIIKSKVSKVLISSENFIINKDPAIIKQLLMHYEVKVIVYLRRHDSWWESAYNQSLKMVHMPRYDKGIEHFIVQQNKVNRLSRYLETVNKWAKVFGVKNVIVRPYEKQQMPHGIVADMMSIIQIAIAQEKYVGLSTNKSLSKTANSILEFAQRSNLTKEQVAKVLNHLKNQSFVDNNMPLLSPKRRKEIVENNITQYGKIAKNYLNREQLFFEPLPDKYESWQKFTPPSTEEVVSVIVHALAEKS